jgi:hypothetical protein
MLLVLLLIHLKTDLWNGIYGAKSVKVYEQRYKQAILSMEIRSTKASGTSEITLINE